MSEFIIRDCDGKIFLSFEKADEKWLDDYSELMHFLAVVTVGKLMGINHQMRQYNL